MDKPGGVCYPPWAMNNPSSGSPKANRPWEKKPFERKPPTRGPKWVPKKD